MDVRTVQRQVRSACNKVFCRKTPNKAREGTAAHPSNIDMAADIQAGRPPMPPPRPPCVEREHAGGGWLLSGVICVNILILGCALVSGSAFNSVAITSVHRQIFLIILLLLTILWMLFYTAFTYRKEQAVLCKDSHAGPVWLRAGLVLFGILSLVMDIFKIANYVGYLHCDSAVKVAFPVVQGVFLVVQTYFLWVHARDCVQKHKDFTRCGLIVTLATNLVLWMAAVAEESVHQTDIPEDYNYTRMYRASHGYAKCKCSHTACSIFKDAYYYLYPFNIEYSLFASAMAYVMWNNVGRQMDDHSHHKAKFQLKSLFAGPIAGTLLVLAGLTTFIVYEVDVVRAEHGRRENALAMHFLVNIVILSLMCAVTVVGCVVYRLEHRYHVSDHSPTRSLDVGLLVAASMGQLLVSYFTIVAVVATGAEGLLNALDLAWAVLMVVQLGLQNFFIIEGLHREPFHVAQEAALHSNACMSQGGAARSVAQQGVNWKRRLLREVCVFLLLANVILWIMPAFGARPQFDHDLEIRFYRFTMWAAIVNIGLPFGIFYRMHSVASLFEVFMSS